MAMVMLFLRQTTGKTERYTHFCMSLKPVFTRDCGNGVHFMDEPLNGLDPIAITDMRELMRKLAAAGMSILLSSHIIGEIRHTANRIGILAGGAIRQEFVVKDKVSECGENFEEYVVGFMRRDTYELV